MATLVTDALTSFLPTTTSMMDLTTDFDVGDVFVAKEVMWMLVSGFVISFVLAFGLGANDVANSFATSVGAKVLTMREACILATFFETAGAVLLGAKVSDTIRKGIFDVSLYEGQSELLMLGQVSALGGACVWLLIATYLKLPVSGTHSIVGAMLGFHLVTFQTEGVNWKQFSFIVMSWIVSPILSGTVSAIVYVPFRKFVLSKDNPLEPGLRALPLLYFFVLSINCFSIFFDGPEMLGFDKVPLWGVLLTSFGVGFITGLVVWFIVVPKLRPKLQELKNPALSMANYPNDIEANGAIPEKKPLESPVKDDTEPTEQTTMVNGNFDDSIMSRDTELDCSLASKETAELNNSSIEVEAVIDENGYVTYCPITSTSTPSPPGGALASTPSPRGGALGRWLRNGSARFSFRKLKESPQKPKQEEEVEDEDEERDVPVVRRICSPLQVLAAIFASFAHGGNDVSNAIGPLIALWAIFQSGEVAQKQATPVWILFYGGVGISVGLWFLGRRVIETVGNKLTTITPSSGFTIEMGAAMTVLTASNLGIPISTTHCKVGSVVAIGFIRSRKGVTWKLFGNIILGWVITLPVTAGVSALIMVILTHVAL